MLMSLLTPFRLIVVAIFCLFVAHPGFVFHRTSKIYYSVATVAESRDDGVSMQKLADPLGEPVRQV